MPSARPRKSEKVPSVTISGGMPSRAIEERVQRPAGGADRERDSAAASGSAAPSRASRSEDDRRQPHQRADRQVDAAGDDDRRQRNGEQADLDAEPQRLEGVAGGEEVRCR